jgi:hypothetical protein
MFTDASAANPDGVPLPASPVNRVSNPEKREPPVAGISREVAENKGPALHGICLSLELYQKKATDRQLERTGFIGKVVLLKSNNLLAGPQRENGGKNGTSGCRDIPRS